MRVAYILVSALLLALPTLAVGASTTQGEQTLSLDLTAIPDGKLYYLKCQAFGAIPCASVSLWTQTNELRGLQTGIYGVAGKSHDPDKPLLS